MRNLLRHFLFVILLPLDCFSLASDFTEVPDSIRNILPVKPASGDISKIHFSWSYGFIFGGPAPGIKKAIEQSGYGGTELTLLALFGFPSRNYPYRQTGAVAMRAGLDVNILPHWRSGIYFSKTTPVEIAGTSRVLETAHRTSWEFMMTHVRRPYRKNYTSRSEFAFGMGLSINKLEVRTRVPVYDANYGNIRTGVAHEASFTKTKPGLVLRLIYDTYLSKTFSLHFGIESRFIPALTVDQTGTYKPLKAHKVNFTSVDSSFGLRLHL